MPGPLAGAAVGAALTLANNIPGRTHFVPIDDYEDDRPTHVEPAVKEAVPRDENGD